MCLEGGVRGEPSEQSQDYDNAVVTVTVNIVIGLWTRHNILSFQFQTFARGESVNSERTFRM